MRSAGGAPGAAGSRAVSERATSRPSITRPKTVNSRLQMRGGGQRDEELRAAHRAGLGHRDHAGAERQVVCLFLDVIAGPARAPARRVAALGDEARDHAVEGEPVEEAVAREEDEVVDVAGRLLRQQLDAYVSPLRADQRLVALGRIDLHRRRRAVCAEDPVSVGRRGRFGRWFGCRLRLGCRGGRLRRRFGRRWRRRRVWRRTPELGDEHSAEAGDEHDDADGEQHALAALQPAEDAGELHRTGGVVASRLAAARALALTASLPAAIVAHARLPASCLGFSARASASCGPAGGRRLPSPWVRWRPRMTLLRSLGRVEAPSTCAPPSNR